ANATSAALIGAAADNPRNSASSPMNPPSPGNPSSASRASRLSPRSSGVWPAGVGAGDVDSADIDRRSAANNSAAAKMAFNVSRIAPQMAVVFLEQMPASAAPAWLKTRYAAGEPERGPGM